MIERDEEVVVTGMLVDMDAAVLEVMMLEVVIVSLMTVRESVALGGNENERTGVEVDVTTPPGGYGHQ